MSSPETLPWQTIIKIEKDRNTPVYLQIANTIMQEMKMGRIGPNIKMPGTRQMSELLSVHRKTVVRAYEELDAQGWIKAKPSKGTFTIEKLPEIVPRKITGNRRQSYPEKTGFPVKVNEEIRASVRPYCNVIGFHDGPDVRLIPVEQLGRAYKSVMTRHANLNYLSYVETAGVEKFRKILSGYLNSTRGLQTSYENIMVTRGSQMGL